MHSSNNNNIPSTKNHSHYPSVLQAVPNIIVRESLSPSQSSSTLMNHLTPNININGIQTCPTNSSSLLTPPAFNRRKYSLPLIYANQLSPSEYLESSKGNASTSFLDTLASSSRGKRLSQVGIAVSHHLSNTIGWKLLASHADIVEQSKCLCARYIRFKLRKSGLIQKRFNLQRLKSICNITLDATTSQVAVELKYLTLELERHYPKVFSTVLGNLNNSHTLPSIQSVQNVLQTIAQELFRHDITWARIAALYAAVGALAVDCVQIGHAEYITSLIETFATFVDRDLASWIAQQGGWDSLIYRFRTEDHWRKTFKYMLLSISILFWAILAYCLT